MTDALVMMTDAQGMHDYLKSTSMDLNVKKAAFDKFNASFTKKALSYLDQLNIGKCMIRDKLKKEDYIEIAEIKTRLYQITEDYADMVKKIGALITSIKNNHASLGKYITTEPSSSLISELDSINTNLDHWKSRVTSLESQLDVFDLFYEAERSRLQDIDVVESINKY